MLLSLAIPPSMCARKLMPKQAKISTDAWIDSFVERVNRSPREPKFAEELPVWLRREQEQDYGPGKGYLAYDWQILETGHNEWIEALERNLPFPFAPSFRSLVRRYVYPDFTVGPLWLFANTGQPLYGEMSEAVLRDKHLSRVLVEHGYLHFARPETGDYDPICFDTGRRLKGGEHPIVRIDHEAILCDSRIGNVRVIAPSFLEFVREFVQAGE